MQKDFDSPFDITVDLYKQLVGVVKTPPKIWQFHRKTLYLHKILKLGG